MHQWSRQRTVVAQFMPTAQHGYTALMSAVDGGASAGGHPECASLLLAAGANMEAKDEVCIIELVVDVYACLYQ